MEQSKDIRTFIVYFAIGLVFVYLIGLLNKLIDKFKNKSAKHKYWIENLEIERKTLHITVWFTFLIVHDICGHIYTNTKLAIVWTSASIVQSFFNLIRLNSEYVRVWVKNNWKGILRNDDEKWPAILVYFLAMGMSVYITDDKIITQLGIVACSTGDAFACFVGRAFPNSTEIRKGKTWAGFMGASISNSQHCWLYLYISGRIVGDLRTNILALVAGFFIGGLSDQVPSKEICLDDNFTSTLSGSLMWYAFLKVCPILIS